VCAGAYAARREGADRRAGLRAGTALIARGEFSLVVVGLVGAAADPRMSTLVAAYVAVLATGGPILTRLVGGRDRVQPGAVAHGGTRGPG
jgi:CPA2 family monovalent cation:H+ antiporter-2